MDLLKTLLIYMIMTAAGATVESGATPVPYEQLHTPVPTTYVVATATPVPATPTPEPTVKPSPTLPPVTLYEGLKGTHVRMLQQLLAELGYLNAQPDGDFGKMTKQAVEAFQQRNGLEADGIAGPQTIAKLYAADRVPHESKVTPVPTAAPTAVPTAVPTAEPTAVPTAVPTAEPTAVPTDVPTAEPTAVPTAEPTAEPTAVSPQEPATAPAPTEVPAPVSADVKVLYVCGQETLKTVTLSLEEGETLVHPAAALVPAGYVLAGTEPVLVTVDKLGVSTPASVVFACEKAE